MDKKRRCGPASHVIVTSVLLMTYLLSFGPACWLHSRLTPGFGNSVVNVVYWPIGMMVLYAPDVVSATICWYAELGIPSGELYFMPCGFADDAILVVFRGTASTF